MMTMDRYARNFPALTPEEQEILKTKTVTVLGCGGLGGYLINGAARLGVGRLRLIDCDVFSESNLNRQLFCTEKNLGKSKAKEAAKAVAAINSEVGAEALDCKMTEENAGELLKGSDLVLDALDNIEGRLIAEHACEELGIYLIHGAAAAWCSQAGTVAPGSRFFEKIYPKEAKLKPPAVLSFAPGFTANVQLSEMLKKLLGREASLEGKLLIADLEQMRINIVEVP